MISTVDKQVELSLEFSHNRELFQRFGWKNSIEEKVILSVSGSDLLWLSDLHALSAQFVFNSIIEEGCQ